MDLLSAPRRRWLRAVVMAGLLGVNGQCRGTETPQQSPDGKAAVHPTTDVHSRHFLFHTDLPPDQARRFLARLEAEVGAFATYWGRQPYGMIECYVMRNLNGFPAAASDHEAIHSVKTLGGTTIMEFAKDGKRQMPTSVMYSAARLEVVKHEAIHAYCHQAFGRVGPVWYSEGMAEVGRYWKDGDTAVRAPRREIEFLRNHPPKSLAEPTASGQKSGDSWQNYASRWALCHFLFTSPNYSRQFRKLGREILCGKDANLEYAYAGTSRQLLFEYLFFLDHIDRGYRVDLCAWDWKKKFAGLAAGRTVSATVAAGHGWQPTGLTVRAGQSYDYVSEGTWQIGREAKVVDARGDGSGRGRLVGVILKDYRLGPEFELGAEGSFQLANGGDLYLRCRDAWKELADDEGQIAVTLRLH